LLNRKSLTLVQSVIHVRNAILKYEMKGKTLRVTKRPVKLTNKRSRKEKAREIC